MAHPGVGESACAGSHFRVIAPVKVPFRRSGVIERVISLQIPSNIESARVRLADAIREINVNSFRVYKVFEPSSLDESIEPGECGSDLIHGDDIEATELTIEIVTGDHLDTASRSAVAPESGE